MIKFLIGIAVGMVATCNVNIRYDSNDIHSSKEHYYNIISQCALEDYTERRDGAVGYFALIDCIGNKF